MTEQRRREQLREMGIMTTSDLIEALGCSKKTLAILRRHGLEPKPGDPDCHYDAAKVEAALARV